MHSYLIVLQKTLMTEKELIIQFYTAFAKGDAKGMISCYHKNILFKDPAFGKLEGKKAKAMWLMLLSKKEESEINISFEILANNQVRWIATYKYGPKKRKVVNKVTASFEFTDGLISKHTDEFNLWKWSQQALGIPGYLIGWSGLMERKIQQTTNHLLSKYISQQAKQDD